VSRLLLISQLLVVALGAGSSARAETAAAEAPAEAASAGSVLVRVEPQQVQLGERFELIVRVRVGTEARRLPASLELDPFELLEHTRAIEQDDDGKWEVFRLQLLTFAKVGEVAIPGFKLLPAADSADGGAEESGPEIEVPSVPVRIQSVLAGIEKPEPRDLAGPVAVQVHDYRLLVYLGLLLLWLLTAWALRQARTAPAAEPLQQALAPARPAHLIALEKLRQIVDDDLLRQDRVHEYFVRVSESVREYLGNRYQFFALDLTSQELLDEVRDRPTPGMDLPQVQQILMDADLVKFARLSPSDEMASRAIDNAYSLVENTRARAEASEAAG